MTMTTFLRVSTSSLLLSMLNVLFILAGLVRIFVYGEPSLEKVSACSKYWRYRKQAEKDIETGRASQAQENLRAALVALGRPPPLTWLDCLSSLSWQLLLLLLDKLKLPQLVRSLMQADCRLQREVVWEAAETFHRLHSVQLCSSGPQCGHLRGLALALTALNLSRNTGGLARPAVQAEIYLLLAIRLKLSWPRLPLYFQR